MKYSKLLLLAGHTNCGHDTTSVGAAEPFHVIHFMGLMSDVAMRSRVMLGVPADEPVPMEPLAEFGDIVSDQHRLGTMIQLEYL
jgi:hypothetical protein